MPPRKPAAKRAPVARKRAAKRTPVARKPAAKRTPVARTVAATPKPKPKPAPRKPAAPPPDVAPAVAIGTVLAIPLDDGRWTACQVVAATDGRPCVASLHWVGDAPPSLDALRGAPPLRIDHHNWRGALDYHHVDATPPPGQFRTVGVLPAPDLGPCNAYGGWGSFGLHIGLQARWDALPEPTRRAYKGAPQGPGTEIDLDLGTTRKQVRVATSGIGVEDGAVSVRWAELDRLPHLTDLGYAGTDGQVLDYVRDHPLISKLSWSKHGRDAIDLRGTNLLEVSIAVVAPLTLTLPRAVRELRVSGDATLLTVEQSGDGRALSLTVGPGADGQTRLPVRGLPALRALRVVNAASIAVAPLVAHPGLTHLYLHGNAVRVPDVEALAGLRALRVLELIHCYGVDAARVPVAAQAWPALERASVDGYKKADAARWKACLAGVATVELRGAKTDAWLAANLDNPFRDWIDRSPTAGKRAAAAWRTARAAIGAAVPARDAEQILRALVEVFNKLDAKATLDTIDREEIGEAFFALAARAGVAAAAAEAWFDRWREF